MEGNPLHEVVETIALALGCVGIAFIAAGTVIAFLQYLNSVFIRQHSMPQVRLTLGTYTLIGLEFMVGQDIVETVINTEFEHLVSLGLIVVLRTVLEFFLGKEVEHLEHEVAHAKHHDHQSKQLTRENTEDAWGRPRRIRSAFKYSGTDIRHVKKRNKHHAGLDGPSQTVEMRQSMRSVA